ncbi:hypothetical protein ACFU7T_14340 [Streptomyces sp. NPDC057555]|uniref:hypothetical protein n=1 Tax=Streptomyces sp. NPDC057555 TaxID=3346166 RepID=UPI00367A5353
MRTWAPAGQALLGDVFVGAGEHAVAMQPSAVEDVPESMAAKNSRDNVSLSK